MSGAAADALTDAVAALAAVLARENAALEALDIPAACALLESKEAAIGALAAARHAAAPATVPAGLKAEAARLRDLAQENRRLLENAMLAQSRVLDVIARAARRTAAATPRYGARGAVAADRPSSIALSARA